MNATVKFKDRLQKSSPLTFKSLYEVSNRDAKGKVTSLKADRTILQRLVTAFQAGRKVDLHHVLQHELMNIPISIRAGTNTPSDEYDTYRDTGWRIRYVSRIHFFSEAKLGNG